MFFHIRLVQALISAVCAENYPLLNEQHVFGINVSLYIFHITSSVHGICVVYIYIYIGELKKSGFRSCRNDPQLFRFSRSKLNILR